MLKETPQYALRRAWCEELRANRHLQYHGGLHDSNGHYCALGILMVKMLQMNQCNYKHQVSNMTGIPYENVGQIIIMNDTLGKSFSQIADYIEEQI
jgi:hypothetical protein